MCNLLSFIKINELNFLHLLKHYFIRHQLFTINFVLTTYKILLCIYISCAFHCFYVILEENHKRASCKQNDHLCSSLLYHYFLSKWKQHKKKSAELSFSETWQWWWIYTNKRQISAPFRSTRTFAWELIISLWQIIIF